MMMMMMMMMISSPLKWQSEAMLLCGRFRIALHHTNANNNSNSRLFGGSWNGNGNGRRSVSLPLRSASNIRHWSASASASSASTDESAALSQPVGSTFLTDLPSLADGMLGKQASDVDGQPSKSSLVFLGTGTSEGIPRVSCLTDTTKKCRVCWEAVKMGNKNRRRNTSLLVRYATSSRRLNILIDVGKFFYHSALQWFPYYQIRNLDAVIITHSHADAIGGLDDLRDWTNNIQETVPIFVAKRDLEVMSKTHYYLLDTSILTPGTAVSKLQFNLIGEDPFDVHGLKVTPLPIWHGAGYRSLGFRMGNVCYISDVSEIPETTYKLLKNCDLLILDALRPDRSSSTHFGLPQALIEIRKIRPKRTLLTGMMHTMDHDRVNEELSKLNTSEGLDVQLSYDGLQVLVDL